MTFTAQILTLYPEMFPGPLGVSLAGRALTEGKWACDPIQIRDFAADKHARGLPPGAELWPEATAHRSLTVLWVCSKRQRRW